MRCPILHSLLFGRKEVRTMIVGLDGVGKTTITYKLKLGEIIDTQSTIGFNVESIDYGYYTFVLWDVGGSDEIKPFWDNYMYNTQALIFVVDCTDSKQRMEQARKTLFHLLDLNCLKNIDILIYANKCDEEDTFSYSEIASLLQLDIIKNPWHLQLCSAYTSEGLIEGLDYLHDSLIHKHF
ncbi:hypothetical protein WA158_001132 [Blastocystis sp. Blastoise]